MKFYGKLLLSIGLLTLLFSGVRKLSPQSYSTSSPGLAATSGSIGGGLLAVGASATGTVTISGVSTGMLCLANASDGTNMVALGVVPTCTVTAANTVTINVLAVVALTPAAKTYNVRVFP